MRGAGGKVISLLMAVVLGIVILVVLMMSATVEEETQCTPGNSGGVAGTGSGLVNSDGLAFPVHASAQFTSGFGERWGEAHNGVDYAGPIGTEIYAFADGVVAAAGPADGFGNWIVLDHKIDGEDHSTVYGHMSADNVLVSAGDTVKAGDHIAGIGSEGYSTGPHLHFEFYNGLKLSGGTPIDPQPMLEEIQADGGSSDRSSGDDADAADDSPTHDQAPPAGSPAGGTSGGNTNEGQDVSLGVANDPNSFDERQLDNIRAIISIGKGRDAPESVIKAAVMAAGPESGYRMLASRAVPESLNYPNDGVTPGDATSVGLYQIQTPMNMPVDQAMDRTRHIEWFYDTADQLADPSQEPWEIAANVERPREDLRYKYQEWEGTADILLRTEGNIEPSSGSDDCDPGSSGGSSSGEGVPADASEFAEKAIAAAREQMGLPYVWGGGDWNGPTGGGFDCSGLTMYAYAQAGGPRLDHYTTNQMNSPDLAERDPSDIQAGDLVFFNGADDPQHVGLAINSTTMIHAPTTGDVVKEAPISDGGDLVAVRAIKEVPSDTSSTTDNDDATEENDDE
ncbi:MAG: peptidoglycan DD-metalloendopeptidase family protein [Micrococcaceae bacterium]